MENSGNRQLLAFLLILVIIILTPKYMDWVSTPGMEPEYLPDSTSQKSDVIDRATVDAPYNSVNEPALISLSPNNKEVRFSVETPLYIAEVSSKGGGSIAELILKQFTGSYSDGGDYMEDGLVSMLLPENIGCSPCIVSRIKETGNRIFRNDVFLTDILNGETIFLTEDETKTIDFWIKYEDGTSIKNALVFNADAYFFDFQYEIDHPFNKSIASEIAWTAGLRPTEKNESYDVSEAGAIIWQAGEAEDLNISSNEVHNIEILDGNTNWTAIKSKYFIASIIPDISGVYGAFAGRNYSFGDRKITPVYESYIGFSHEINKLSGKIFIGPQDVNHLRKTGSNIEEAMNWGYFFIRPISKLILTLLTFFHKPVNGIVINYGIVLILFAFIIRILTGPLTKKAALSNQKIQKLQPKLKKLQSKFKDDPTRLQQETMKIWRENKVNPMGGCLPIIVQMPLLFALFVTFRATIEFRGAPFVLWINDLSQPDTIFNLPFSIPIYGSHVAVLPLIMGFSMFIQQKMTSANLDKNQKPMMYMMTGFFFLIFNSFPSGLNLYYATSNFLNILQQRNLKKAGDNPSLKV